MTVAQQDSPDVPSSPEDGSNFKRSLQIDMKGLVGDAVGNMSISPGSRDVVLAARKGLFIIDLEAPLNVPRFLPQGGTWDVADVQWNPHIARQEYIVSTSSEKLLIWNLYLSGKTSIEHILRSHYRAITDINWHTTDPDVVVSTGIDSWLWAWDLRTPGKPVMGLCAFNAAGTQVKWNRQDGNILASSHSDEVLIWDRRKGSLPVSQIKAHSAKIYGIDWSHKKRDELVTCSLDKTIKVWDIKQPADHTQHQPTLTINTTYPIWRARDLPFGHGVLSLPQRGETALEMYSPNDPFEPVEKFEGHADVVKEFVWRKGEKGEFQLITWSKDKTLRFWPIDEEVMQKVGSSKTPLLSPINMPYDERVSFSNPPIASDLPPALSAPVGHRAILAEVRASQPLRPQKLNALRHSQEAVATRPSSKAPGKTIAIPDKAGTMSRGYVGGRSAQITTYAWLSSVKVGSKREDSSGPASGGESGNASRLNSRSRPPSIMDPSMSFYSLDGRSGSRDRDDGSRETESNQSLQDEITSVVKELTAAKVKLEKADLTKKRTCTFGLHGPWGSNRTSVFIRISFNFPRDYPQAVHPSGTPDIDFDRNPLISLKNRLFITRRLRGIREHERPCLAACLRFLLFGDEDEDRRPQNTDSESSSEDDEAQIIARRGKEGTFSLLRGDKTLTEPRTSQGVFGPNGELVCFFRAPPRIVRNALRELSSSPSPDPRTSQEPAAPRLFWSPILLSDAVRRLQLASHDQDIGTLDVRRAEDAHSILRIMSNLFTFSHQKSRRVSEQSSLRPNDDLQTNYSLLPTRRSTVYIKDASLVTGLDVEAARRYMFPVTDAVTACKQNADTARLLGRLDHERVFGMLQVLLTEGQKSPLNAMRPGSMQSFSNPLSLKIMEKLYSEVCSSKDIQMLAMMSVILLRLAAELRNPSRLMDNTPTPNSIRIHPQDYFSAKHNAGVRRSPRSPLWARSTPSPTSGQPLAPALTSPSSSRGSWSSLFNASSMRRFIAASKTGGPVNSSRLHHSPSSPQIKEYRSDSVGGPSAVPRSWSDATDITTARNSVSYSSAGHHRRPTFSQVVSSGPPSEERKRVVVEITPQSHLQMIIFRLQPRQRRQLEMHVWAYANMLVAWSLPHKRIELLDAAEIDLRFNSTHPVLGELLELPPLGLIRHCSNCEQEITEATNICSMCDRRQTPSRCAVCRLPIKGLSHACLRCFHITHIQCWKARQDNWCATGCGCSCIEEGMISNEIAQSPTPLPVTPFSDF